MAAKSKPIEDIPATYTGNKVEIEEMKLPPAKASGKIFTNGKMMYPNLSDYSEKKLK